MGIFNISAEVAKPSGLGEFVRAGSLMVDTGSELTWINRATLADAGISIRKKDQAFVMANGTQITRQVGYAINRSGEFETIDEVVFAEPSDMQLLGARTLEGFNATVDPTRKRLVAAGPMPAAALSPTASVS